MVGVVSVCSVLSVLALLLAWWASGFGPVLVNAFFFAVFWFSFLVLQCHSLVSRRCDWCSWWSEVKGRCWGWCRVVVRV